MAEKDKTKFVLKAEIVTSFSLPKTLIVQTEMMPFGGATVAIYTVYGRDATDRRVWCATFIDMEEAQAWVQASKVFGRTVKGAVIANQEKEIDETVDEDAPRIIGGNVASKGS